IYGEAARKQIREKGLFPGVKDTLENLYKEGYPMYIVSGGGTDQDLGEMAEDLDVSRYFRGIFGFGPHGASLISFGKEENIKRVMALEQDSDPSHYIIIGDGETDKLFAEETGCRFIGIANRWNGWAVDNKQIMASLGDAGRLIKNSYDE
ncbi:MAG: HAD hydrolase-like protein, partial [Minisyncoccia bacterium]